jgi:hypothetical protein
MSKAKQFAQAFQDSILGGENRADEGAAAAADSLIQRKLEVFDQVL